MDTSFPSDVLEPLESPEEDELMEEEDKKAMKRELFEFMLVKKLIVNNDGEKDFPPAKLEGEEQGDADENLTKYLEWKIKRVPEQSDMLGPLAELLPGVDVLKCPLCICKCDRSKDMYVHGMCHFMRLMGHQIPNDVQYMNARTAFREILGSRPEDLRAANDLLDVYLSQGKRLWLDA